MNDEASLAAFNNAEWCDAVSSAHGAACRFEAGFWINPGAAPPFYPNLVTLDRAATAEQRAAIERLAATSSGGLGIKDSFSAPDLADLGLAVAFTAQWLWCSPEAGPDRLPDGFTCRLAEDAEALAGWERRWGGDPDKAPIFPPALLSDPRIAFLSLSNSTGHVAGAALYRSPGVLGLSNVHFTEGADEAAALRAILAAARTLHPGLPVVGYEEDDRLALFREAGFSPIGRLRVWVR